MLVIYIYYKDVNNHLGENEDNSLYIIFINKKEIENNLNF